MAQCAVTVVGERMAVGSIPVSLCAILLSALMLCIGFLEPAWRYSSVSADIQKHQFSFRVVPVLLSWMYRRCRLRRLPKSYWPQSDNIDYRWHIKIKRNFFFSLFIFIAYDVLFRLKYNPKFGYGIRSRYAHLHVASFRWSHSQSYSHCDGCQNKV